MLSAGLALLEFSGSAGESSRGSAHTVTDSDSEDTDIHSQSIESLYGEVAGGAEIGYTLTNRGDRVAGTFAVSASAAGRSAGQSYGTVTQRVQTGVDGNNDPIYQTETTPVRGNEAASTSLAVAVRGGFSDDSLGPDNLGQANVHTESGHVTRTENSAARASAFAGLVLPLDGFDDQEEPVYVLPAAGAYSLEKTTLTRARREDYDYADEGAGLTQRGTFDDDTQRTAEKTRVLQNIPLDGMSAGTEGTYSAKSDTGGRQTPPPPAASTTRRVPLALPVLPAALSTPPARKTGRTTTPINPTSSSTGTMATATARARPARRPASRRARPPARAHRW